MRAVAEPFHVGVAPPAAAPRPGASIRDYAVLFALVLASRLTTTLHYVADPDSLRFALGVRSYSVADLRPHFPGYPVFTFLAKGLTLLTGSFAVAFSIVGAIAVFAIIVYLQRLLRVQPRDLLGLAIAALVFLNPLIWLLSNRYMPDLLGAACAVAALYHLADGRRGVGFFLAGLLPGIRLSYLPFLLPPVLFALRMGALRGVLLGMAGVLVWLVPLIVDTGWSELVHAARTQTTGHFGDFGGTVYTEPELGQRVTRMVHGLWAHGLGGYWVLRHPITAVVGIGAAVCMAFGGARLRSALPRHVGVLLVASWVTYFLWIFFYQNVIHQTRHVLPLLPLLLVAMALGVVELIRRGRSGRLTVAGFLAAQATLAVTLAAQHRQPTALAQVAESLRHRGGGEVYVVSIPLANFYLASVGVRAHFVDREPGAAAVRVPPGARVVAVGMDREIVVGPSAVRTFYHNPYVNPVWPEIVVREYAPRSE